ncbi:hypothetical protein D3C85_1341040 [compost metagenome]
MRPGQHGDLVRRYRLAAALLVPSGNGFTQGALATHVGVVGVAGQQAVDGRLHDGHWRVEVRVAHRQQQNVFALFPQRQCAVVDIPGGGAVTGDTLSQIGKAHGPIPASQK